MINKIKYKLFGKFQNKKRLEQMKKNPFKRVDSQKMTDIEKTLECIGKAFSTF